jgi:hypothetical protein
MFNKWNPYNLMINICKEYLKKNQVKSLNNEVLRSILLNNLLMQINISPEKNTEIIYQRK